MKCEVLDSLLNLKNPVAGREVRPDERYCQALTSARYAEQFGFDAVALGERHAGAFLSSGVTVLLGAIAATTSRVRIQTGLSVLSIEVTSLQRPFAGGPRVRHGSATTLTSASLAGAAMVRVGFTLRAERLLQTFWP
ncbi:LLM class flavin-dependent oxidoreductase [Streptomyces sp. NPDC086549]|uniref:LLM class flavin-dependent oxidoreductase n=1 Tax=Streptomyces sp. NPDC086549 TaxID=3365752 RepID=UPI0037FC5FD7